MMTIGLSELIVIFFVAYIIVGPKDLPKVVRFVARGIKKISAQIKEIKDEAGWDDIVNEIGDTKSEIEEPIKDTGKELTKLKDMIEENTEK